MTVHLIKLCVGCDSIEDLASWQTERLKARRKAGERKPQLFHRTFQTPKRRAELILSPVPGSVPQARRFVATLDFVGGFDSDRLALLTAEIVTNAIRFTPAGGQIVVSTAYEHNGSVVIRFRDTGIGMTRSELEQAMRPFRQVPGGSRVRGEGTGLGLPLTKAMVEANRAQFEITSTPDEGTLVEITFPPQRVLAD